MRQTARCRAPQICKARFHEFNQHVAQACGENPSSHQSGVDMEPNGMQERCTCLAPAAYIDPNTHVLIAGSWQLPPCKVHQLNLTWPVSTPRSKRLWCSLNSHFCMPGQQSCMSDNAYDVLFVNRLAAAERNTALPLHSAACRGNGSKSTC